MGIDRDIWRIDILDCQQLEFDDCKIEGEKTPNLHLQGWPWPMVEE